MKALRLFLVCVGAMAISSCASKSSAPLATVPQVDAKKYMGKWYEIARLPNSFQNENTLATADYALQRNGTIRVLNTEHQKDFKTKTATGIATPVTDSGNARLKVEFTGLASLVPVPEEGNYWILKLESDYSMVLVGTPDRKFLWLLSRSLKPAPEKKESYIKYARRKGFDTSKLIHADWSGWKVLR